MAVTVKLPTALRRLIRDEPLEDFVTRSVLRELVVRELLYQEQVEPRDDDADPSLLATILRLDRKVKRRLAQRYAALASTAHAGR